MSEKKFKGNNKKVFWAITIVFLTVLIFLGLQKPSNERDWAIDQEILPEIKIEGNFVEIENIRNFKYKSETEYEKGYYNKSFDLNKIKSVDFILEPFSEWDGAAHTFLSFGFEDGEYIAVSIEIRKEKGEEFSAWKGLLNQYEIMYVIADENDVVKLRSNFRKDDVYIYPIKANQEKIRILFLDMVQKAQKLQSKPEFYNTITNTCTTGILQHVNKISPKKIPLDFRVLAPGYSDKLGYELGLFDTKLSFEDAKEKFYINERAEKFADSPNFSKLIRE